MRTEDDARQYYHSLPNERIIKIALLESGDLTERGLEIMQEELDSRDLLGELVDGIEASVNGLDQEQIEMVFQQLKSCPCPDCSSTGLSLESGIVIKSRGFFLFSMTEEAWKFACPNCLGSMMKAARNQNFLSGWMSIRGLFKTAQSAVQVNKHENKKQEESQNGFLQLIMNYPGFFWLYKHDPQKLTAALKDYNERSKI